MIRAMRSLRVRLAFTGALAIYLPVLLVFAVTSVTRYEVVEIAPDGGTATSRSTIDPSDWTVLTVVALGPAAVALAWW